MLAIASCAVPFLVITFASLKYDRYSLPLWPVGAVLAALVVEVGALELARRWRGMRTVIGPTILAGVGLIVLASVLVGRDANVYANPAVGGSTTAQDVLLIGGPEASRAGELIDQRQGGHCDHLRVFTPMPRGPMQFPCGRLVESTSDLRRGDYVVLDQVSIERKLVDPAPYRSLGVVVAHIQRRGIDLADVIQVR